MASPASDPATPDHRILWSPVGATLIIISITYLANGLGKSRLVDVVLVVVGLWGVYALVAPFLGLPLPKTRSNPFWHHEPKVEAGSNDPSPAPAKDPDQSLPPPSSTAPVPTPQALLPAATASSSRVKCPLSPKQLTDLYAQGVTEALGDLMVASYIGQWREVTGTVEGAKKHNDQVFAVDCKDPEQVSVCFFFDPQVWAARVQGVMPGQPFSAAGRVLEVTRSLVIFDDCELVSGTERLAQ